MLVQTPNQQRWGDGASVSIVAHTDAALHAAYWGGAAAAKR